MRRIIGWQRKRKPLPVKPSPPIASEITTTSVRISGQPMASASNYIYQMSTAATGPYYNESNGKSLSFTKSDLSLGTTYYFRRNYSIGGSDSVWSDYIEVTTLTIVSPPDDPTDPPVATVITPTTITLNWEVVNNASTYTLQRSLQVSSNYSNIATITGTEYIDTNLAQGTTYYYRYFASNTDGNSATSNYVQATTSVVTSPPATPTSPPSVTSKSSTSISLSIAAVTNADEYIIQKSATGVTGSWSLLYRGTNRTYTVSGLLASTTYYYRYSALNDAGQSGWSSSLSVTTDPSSGIIKNMQPVSGFYIRSRSGMAAHPNFLTDVYRPANAERIVSDAAAAGLTFIRGMFPGTGGDTAAAQDWAAALRTHNMKWLMTVIPSAKTETSTYITNQTITTTKAKVETIKRLYSDICVGLEGINEPNSNRDGTPIASDWAKQTYDYQVAIFETARAVMSNGAVSTLRNVPIVGPSLHDTAVERSNGAHWTQLYNLGIQNYQTMVGLHTYPGGSFPTRKLDYGLGGEPGRLQYIKNTFGENVEVWCTEWGYHNAFGWTGHRPITEKHAGIFTPRGYLQFITNVYSTGGIGVSGVVVPRNNMYLTYYESLDDPDINTAVYLQSDVGTNGVTIDHVGERKSSDHEKHFGYATVESATTSTWGYKPVHTQLGLVLNAMKDPANVTVDYIPNKVRCVVTPATTGSKLQWQVTATKAQSNANTATLWIWRDMVVWDREAGPSTNEIGAAVTVPAVYVDVEDGRGTTRIQVAGEIVRLDLRAPLT